MQNVWFIFGSKIKPLQIYFDFNNIFRTVVEAWFIGRVSDHGPEGRGFESLLHRDLTTQLSQPTKWACVRVDLLTQEAIIKSS